MRRKIKTGACLAAAAAGGFLSIAMAMEKPNIVMVFADDLRHDAVGYAGNPHVQTPHLDKLAGSGLVFRNCFVNTSICAVSRANLMAGQYPGRHGIDDFYKTFSEKQLSDTVPGRLQRAGYQTAFFGKWGIGDGPEKTHEGAAVFDYWAGQPMQTCFFHQPGCRYVEFNGFDRPLDDLCDCPADAQGNEGYRNRIGRANLTDPMHTDSEVVPLHVKRFLDGRNEKKPFCMMLFFKAPHSPFGDWDPAVKSVAAGETIPLPAGATLENARNEPQIVKDSLGRPSGMAYLEKPAVYQKHIHDYYRLVSSMDLGIGRVMELLKARGLDQDTVILFTSDNGHFKGEHGLAGKWLMYEPSLQVPGFVYDPRRKGGLATDAMAITTDFSVTMLELAGIKKPDSMTGRDLTKLYADPAAAWRDDFYYDHPYGHGGAIPRTIGVRSERYAYTRYIDPDPPFEQLFDLENDPHQLNNLIDSPEHALLASRMRKRCDRLAEEVGPQ